MMMLSERRPAATRLGLKMLAISPEITQAHLNEVYSDSYLSRVARDGRPFAPVSHPLADYYSAWVDGEFAGAYLSIRHSEWETEIHSLLFRPFSRRAKELGRLMLALLFASPIFRVTAYVYSSLFDAVRYCKSMGFVEEGRRRDAAMKGGRMVDIVVLGVTRNDWEALA